MRKYPTDESDRKELARLAPEPWMTELLRLNPAYLWWGPHEDYMWKDKNSGWDSPLEFDSWREFKDFSLDDLNECVNFYFFIGRPHRDCDTCKSTGHHPDAQWITESWYRHSSPFTVPDDRERLAKAILEKFGSQFTPTAVGRGTLPPEDVINRYGKPFLDHCVSTIENGGEWSTNITQDEVDALWDSERMRTEFRNQPTAEEVNRAAKSSTMLHDAINRYICCKRRCERLGVPYECPSCEGHGHLFTGPAFLGLTLWWLHPRKGCSRGIEVRNLRQREIPVVLNLLSRAAARNAQRFSAAVDAAKKHAETAVG
ncbi:MAG TPA: hypothetical protein VFW94_23695 [Candidatus Acidoferrales bacterium]|nr:hypothetical protein [Candidatus Acidoferrales bacterium]